MKGPDRAPSSFKLPAATGLVLLRHSGLELVRPLQRGAGWTGLVAQQALDAILGKALLPAPNRGPADASLPSHVLHAQPFGRQQDNERPQDVLGGRD